MLTVEVIIFVTVACLLACPVAFEGRGVAISIRAGVRYDEGTLATNNNAATAEREGTITTYGQCPCWCFLLERYKLCGHKPTTQRQYIVMQYTGE